MRKTASMNFVRSNLLNCSLTSGYLPGVYMKSKNEVFLLKIRFIVKALPIYPLHNDNDCEVQYKHFPKNEL